MVIALGQLLASSLPAFVGSASPRISHQLQQLAPSRHRELQGSKVTAHFFKKLLNRKKKANSAETAHGIEEPAVFKKIESALEKGELEAAGSISTAPAQVAEPVRIVQQQMKPIINLKSSEAVASPQVTAEDGVVWYDEPTEEASMDDFSFKVTEEKAPVTSLLKKEDDIYDFFVELTDRIESLWNARKAMA